MALDVLGRVVWGGPSIYNGTTFVAREEHHFMGLDFWAGCAPRVEPFGGAGPRSPHVPTSAIGCYCARVACASTAVLRQIPSGLSATLADVLMVTSA